MTKYLFILLLSLPQLACASDTANSNSITIEQRINSIMIDQSNGLDRQYWRSLLKWSDECEAAFQGPTELLSADMTNTDSGLKVYPAENKQYILRVTCALGGYQGYQQLYFVSYEGSTVVTKDLMFPVLTFENSNNITKTLSQEIWGNFLRSSNYKQMTILNRYSGYGHCGTMTTYSIIHGKVTAIKLLAQPDCESKNASRDPEKWASYAIPWSRLK